MNLDTIGREETMAATPIPDGYATVTPYLTPDDARAAIEFCKRAFGATERGVMAAPDGRIAHAELQIGDSIVMLSDKFPQSSVSTPKELGGTTVAIFLYVEDVDTVVKAATDAGATVIQQPEDQFWGDRLGQVRDPFGNVWQIATHVEDVSPEEMEKRSREAMAAIA
jgi:PhnB protein